MFIDHGVYSHIGKRRHNQDAVKVISESTSMTDKRWLFAVADGMGGHKGGGVASELACDGLNHYYERRSNSIRPQRAKSIRDRLVETIIRIDRNIRLYGLRSSDLEDMGTTLSCLVITPEHSIIAHVGDSRIYRLRNGHLSCLTVDHTFVQDMVFEGEVKQEEAHLHPLAHMLTRVVGSREQLTHVDSRIDPLKLKDSFLLCSDGLYNTLTNKCILDLLSNESSASTTAVKIVKQALQEGAMDNVTVIVVKIK
ncbi:MAG: protein phosphatase 2C domain-containing protein [Proteobacteria bacterium]|nr:protein phosphatase 2C domain-containing protein [Pseudomonadota bacterium]MBU4470591.1 protein phosphatase 2C domain-containing protein [Pseudomonadota bacterium]MCG2751426.1 protein phosphatase 2C domain-containing protein [Desulfobacteraceae bacterium]